MELLLISISLWILQCNLVQADSIIHIGKEPQQKYKQSCANGKKPNTHNELFCIILLIHLHSIIKVCVCLLCVCVCLCLCVCVCACV